MDKDGHTLVIEIPETEITEVHDLQAFVKDKLSAEDTRIIYFHNEAKKFSKDKLSKIFSKRNDAKACYLIFDFEEAQAPENNSSDEHIICFIKEYFDLHLNSIRSDGNMIEIEIFPELHHQHYAVAEFHIGKKVHFENEKDVNGLANKIANLLETGNFKLLSVFEYLGSLEGLNYDIDNESSNLEGTYFAVSLIMDTEDIQNWKNNSKIIDKTILELKKSEINLSTYNENTSVAFFAFTKDYD